RIGRERRFQPRSADRDAARHRGSGDGADLDPEALRVDRWPGVLARVARSPAAEGRMRVCVVGCGAVGSLFAANLATLPDVETWAFDLNEMHIEAINEKGLQLRGAGDVLGRPRGTSDPAELPSCDFGIVATKAMHADSAIAATAHAFANGSVA